MKKKLTFYILILFSSACQTEARGIPFPFPDPEPRTYSNKPQALVIGNAQYKHNRLSNSVNDAVDMKRVLTEIGFDVTLKTDLADRRAMKAAIRGFAKRLSHSKGVGLFYFAGHGAQVDGRNYLFPTNNDVIKDKFDLESDAVYAGEILQRMEQTKTSLNILILDACRDNPYRSSRSMKRGLARMPNTKIGSIIAFATATGETASDASPNGRNGLYTSYLLKAIKNAYQTNQRIDDMFMQVSNAVLKQSKKRQEPWYYASLRQPVYFGKKITTTLPPPPPPSGTIFSDRSILEPNMVDIKNGIAISRYEITFTEYEHFAEATGREKPNDKGWGRGKRPVINVSWHDAVAYTKWLSQKTGKKYRLPTEAEWQYAVGAETLTRNQANCDGCGSRWDNQKTAPVGSFQANRFGLYDMLGNVQEWTGSEYKEKFIVQLGGSWRDFRSRLTTGYRDWRKPSKRFDFVGFRVVRE